ncbi:P-loop containing nucleoside triphosphate hydrolase protein [Pseudoneurospora amorphoporcata]|uniref:P-loop containing nucleoside triphosphate hydrolase protein n=1 Tax=Pseudoneurospora amorphoporcata TaxID=241081 RepID=A0AAN6NSX9_9PEZI|nr:P-loop containing nucleoside triphosphate hydrolase protein [Pseudoneurospora amorphoporcata]
MSAAPAAASHGSLTSATFWSCDADMPMETQTAAPVFTTEYCVTLPSPCHHGPGPCHATYTVTEECTGDRDSWTQPTGVVPPGFVVTTVTDCNACHGGPTQTFTVRANGGPAGPTVSTSLPGDALCISGLEADKQFGPQVDVACREFDFTLLFEDGFFMLLPAALFLLFVPGRLWSLWKSPVKLNSRRLAVGKLTLLSALFTLHLLNTIYTTKSSIQTVLSLPVTILTTIALLSSALLSLLEDQRTIHPSDLLVIYFSASTILFIPRLRTLFVLPQQGHSSQSTPSSTVVPYHLVALQILWTLICSLTTLVAITESLGKFTLLQPRYKHVVVTKEQTAGFWSRGFFVWLLPFFQVGYKKILGMGDIPGVDGELRVESSGGRMEAAFRRLQLQARRLREKDGASGSGGKQEKKGEGKEDEEKRTGWILIRAAYEANKWPFWSAVVPRLALLGFSLCQPFLIEAIVGYLASREWKEADEGETAEAPQPAYYGRALVGGFVLLYIGIAVSRAIYWRQQNRMIARIRSGLIAMVYQHTTALRAVDHKNVHELWASIPGVGIAIWLLARQVSYAAIVPLVICLICVVGASFIGAGTGPAQAAWNERVQKRVAVTANMLGDMKAVKMLGPTGVLGNIIESLRRAEIKTSEKFRKYLVWNIQVSNAPANGVAPYATFVVYGIMSAMKKDQNLLAAQTFASLSLINLLTTPLFMFCQAYPAAMQAVACFGRIETYLTKQELEQSDLSSVEDSGRSAGEHDATESVLQDMNLTIKPGFTAIIGPVGSGKSTLLESLVGETTVKRGCVATNFSSAAYCPQAAWLVNDTIRRNITGGSEHYEIDRKWYDSCILSCGLQRDLEGMVAGDQTVAGTNGSSLSGGQRQRVSLARAVYSRAPVVILDDVMSGLDHATAKEITTRLFSRQGHLRKAGVSVILATHNKRLLPYMDEIIVLKSGRIADIGPYSEIQSRGDLKLMQNPGHNNTPQQQQPAKPPNLERRQGSWSVYSYYACSAGALSLSLWAFFTILGAITSNYMTIWISTWSSASTPSASNPDPNPNLGYYLGIYTLLVVLAQSGAVGECFVFLINIISHRLIFFLGNDNSENTSEDTGTITNRFSQDMDLIDMTLPIQAIMFTSAGSYALVQLIILCVLGKYLAATIPLLAITLFLVQKYYLRSSRQLRLLDIEAKAPVYKHFLETVMSGGVVTIRAFGWGERWNKRLAKMVDEAQKPFYMLACIQQWLALVLDLVVGGMAVVLVGVAVGVAPDPEKGPLDKKTAVSAGVLGVSLVLVMTFNELIVQTLQAWTRLETSIGAVARVRDFGWPSRGEIKIEKICASYGKTTFLLSLLRMIPLSSGSITIDALNLSTTPRPHKSPIFNVIPQDPFFIPNTSLAFNLDPFSYLSPSHLPLTEAARAKMESALRLVTLWPGRVTANGKTLDSELITSEWSVGELQLLALARALLMKDKTKILVLDEATSSVDEKTEAVMQEVIEREFEEHTVISVVHRLTYIEWFDLVAVLNGGEMVEFGAPGEDEGEGSGSGCVFGELYRGLLSGEQE